MTARTIHANLTVRSIPLPRITFVVASVWTLAVRQVIRVPWRFSDFLMYEWLVWTDYVQVFLLAHLREPRSGRIERVHAS